MLAAYGGRAVREARRRVRDTGSSVRRSAASRAETLHHDVRFPCGHGPICEHFLSPAVDETGADCVRCARGDMDGDPADPETAASSAGGRKRKRASCAPRDLPYERSFASFDAAKVACWSIRNEPTPRQVALCSNKKFYFTCNGGCGHEFQTTLNNASSLGRWCPYCSGQTLCDGAGCDHCHRRSFASFDVAKVASWSERNLLAPRQVNMHTSRKYWFKCDCGHDFETALSSVTTEGSWCPYCAPSNKKVCDDFDCRRCHDRSFASFDPVKVACWSPRNLLTPRQVLRGSNKKACFACDSGCGHEFHASPANITSRAGSWCPYCAGKVRCDITTCVPCHEWSFASFDPAKVACWSTRNELTPRQVAKRSNKEYWFTCDGGCGHEFKAALNNVTSAPGKWCPYCFGRTLCDIADCVHCHDRSFAAFDPVKVSAWSSRNINSPRQVTLGSQQKAVFCCARGHEFQAKVSSVTRTNGSWCPVCRESKSEARAAAVLDGMGLTYVPQYRLPGQTRGGFDFGVMRGGELHFLLEMDGEQHFHPMTFGSTTKTAEDCLRYAVERDERKDALVAASGARLLRIPYTEYATPERIAGWIEHFLTAIAGRRDATSVIMRVDARLYAGRPAVPVLTAGR